MGVGSATQQEQEPVWEVIQDMASKVNNCSIKRFVSNQLATWTLAAENFMALKKVCVKEVELNGLTVRLQFNPARIVSSAAKLGKEDILKRRCFLCGKNRPKEQRWIDFVTATGHEYHILVNPYPIFPEHLVIALADHSDQAISGRFEDMLALSEALHGRTIFYNGPKSGASAPDHHHFQAALNGLMPLQNDVESCPRQGVLLAEYNDATLYHYNKFSPGIFVINSKSAASASSLFYRLLDCADTPDGDVEPRINLYSWWTGEEFRVIVYFRRCHRSHHYFSLGEDHLTMSPGCADMAGVFIVPVKEEYDRITAELLGEMISEVTIPKEEQARIIERLTRTQPALSVGIMSAEEIRFEIFADGKGVRPARLENGKIRYEGGLHDELYFGAEKSFSLFAPVSFALHGVTIGVDFHWERQQLQQFAGDLKIVVDGDRLTAVNVIGVEDYLLSVISSEMRADAPEEFLKAHAVISRSWIMARMQADSAADSVSLNEGGSNADNEYIKWYDHDDHRLFDVCADDHCQRYQGLTLAAGEMVRRVIDLTWGQVLVHDGKLCDARFSKCCGGRTEEFSVCWQDKDYSYLQSLPDTPDHDPDGECFCKTDDKTILSKVLNDYDQETMDFFEWTEETDPVTLGNLMERKLGASTGRIKALEPLERGGSGRICRLRVVGELMTVVVGKELEIRRVLSDTHLKSSAFEVEYITEDGTPVGHDGNWSKIRLKGRGWGHGVGLCQIGAAVMSARGYTYHEILSHYYPGSNIEIYAET